MKKQSEIIVPDNIATNLRDGVIVHSETGSYTVLPPATIITAERVFGKIGVDSIEQIAPDITDGVPIFKLNEAPTKAKCHRQACHWAPPPTPLNDPPREAFGKGMTAQQSKASAMMEAVERYCGQCFSHNIIIEADYDSLARYAINPSEFIFPTLPPKCQSCLTCRQGEERIDHRHPPLSVRAHENSHVRRFLIPKYQANNTDRRAKQTGGANSGSPG